MSIRPEKAFSRTSGSAAVFQWEPSREPPTPASPKTSPAPKRTLSGVPVGRHPDEGGHGDEDERCGRGLLRCLAGGVDEGGDSQDRSAATERAQRQADEEAER